LKFFSTPESRVFFLAFFCSGCMLTVVPIPSCLMYICPHFIATIPPFFSCSRSRSHTRHTFDAPTGEFLPNCLDLHISSSTSCVAGPLFPPLLFFPFVFHLLLCSLVLPIDIFLSVVDDVPMASQRTSTQRPKLALEPFNLCFDEDLDRPHVVITLRTFRSFVDGVVGSFYGYV